MAPDSTTRRHIIHANGTDKFVRKFRDAAQYPVCPNFVRDRDVWCEFMSAYVAYLDPVQHGFGVAATFLLGLGGRSDILHGYICPELHLFYFLKFAMEVRDSSPYESFTIIPCRWPTWQPSHALDGTIFQLQDLA